MRSRQGGSGRTGKVFIHGAALQIATNANNRPLADLAAHRLGDSLSAVIGLKGSTAEQLKINLPAADSSLAWEVDSDRGFLARPELRSEHGESEARFRRMIANDSSPDHKTAAIDSKDADCRTIGLCSATEQLMQRVNILHIVGDSTINLSKLKRACGFLGIDLLSIARLRAISGSDFTPGAQGCSKLSFVKCWLANCRWIGDLCDVWNI